MSDETTIAAYRATILASVREAVGGVETVRVDAWPVSGDIHYARTAEDVKRDILAALDRLE